MAVTNFNDANIALFKLQSGGAAYDITLPFKADIIEWWRNTGYATDAVASIQGIWIDGMTDDEDGGLVISRGTTDLTSAILTTTGIEELSDGSGFAATNVTPTAINVTTSVVTSAAHGFTEGQFVRGNNFRSTPVAIATGCYGLNNRVFQIGTVATNTFELLEPYTTVIADLTAEVAFVNTGVAKFNLIGQELGTVNPAPVYQYSLGTGVMGTDNDIIFIRATKANVYTNLGDVA
jgi:hypothetical protein